MRVTDDADKGGCASADPQITDAFTGAGPVFRRGKIDAYEALGSRDVRQGSLVRRWSDTLEKPQFLGAKVIAVVPAPFGHEQHFAGACCLHLTRLGVLTRILATKYIEAFVGVEVGAEVIR